VSGLTEEEIKLVVRATVAETLVTLGIEHQSPLEMQKDFQHLREWRETTEAMKSKGMIAAASFVVVAFLGATWIGIKHGLGLD
jgi:hypothetical protein